MERILLQTACYCRRGSVCTDELCAEKQRTTHTQAGWVLAGCFDGLRFPDKLGHSLTDKSAREEAQSARWQLRGWSAAGEQRSEQQEQQLNYSLLDSLQSQRDGRGEEMETKVSEYRLNACAGRRECGKGIHTAG